MPGVEELIEAVMGDLTEGAPEEVDAEEEVATADGTAREAPSEEDVLRWVQADKDQAKQRADELSGDRIAAYGAYKAQSDGREREGRSKVVLSKVMDAVEWMLPSLMRIYFSADEICVAEPVGKEDVDKAKLVTSLLNDQYIRHAKGFVKTYQWFKDALVYGTGIAKIGWDQKTEYRQFLFEELDEATFRALEADEDTDIHEYEIEEIAEIQTDPMTGIPIQAVSRRYYNVKGIAATVSYEGISLDVIPPEDYLYDPTATSQDECLYEIHRVKKTIDECLRLQDDGVYRNVDRLVELAGRLDADATQDQASRLAESGKSDFAQDESSSSEQIGRRVITVYEWWGRLDDGTGRLEPYVVTFADDVILRMEPNPYNHRKSPFIVLRPTLDIHQFEGIGLAELLGREQEVMTSILRQYLDNLSWQNNGGWVIQRDAGVDQHSLLNPRPGMIVETDKMGAVQPITPPSIGGFALQGLEMMEDRCASKTGVTKYSQGLDAKSLNKTATGISQIMSRSDARIELVARLFAESGMTQMFSMAMSLNQQFLSRKYSMRIYGEVLEVAPDDLDGTFDVHISVGTSPGRQEIIAQQMIQLLQMSGALTQMGIMTPDGAYGVVEKLLESWGHKDIGKYITEPNYIQGLQQQIQQLTQQLQQTQQVQQQQQMIPRGAQNMPPEVLRMLMAQNGQMGGMPNGGGPVQVGGPSTGGANTPGQNTGGGAPDPAGGVGDPATGGGGPQAAAPQQLRPF